MLDSNEVDPAKTQYTCNASGAITLGGNVSGLPWDGSQSVTLQNLGVDDLMMSVDGSDTFTTGLAKGSVYQVAVDSQPSACQCEFADYSESASGTLGNSNLPDLDLTCY
ncbi:hypothetical protein A11A3_00400 [Alcanivorax hongdengensis A-11-3]|uniref:Uncharacterized protein n=1 Tax=Alcanivorax hongdengensis A-11-3 TaxID=1177179 RepID=L0WGE9_9GAMM|nr:hypothetical protein [Alcanivorax hongdengensis]EKF75908.1 hypothetical protein A11A3_00400 [Alcanivorax hongdengensis A-11-3]